MLVKYTVSEFLSAKGSFSSIDIVILLHLLRARFLVKLRNEIDARTFKAQLISGSRFFINSKTLSYPTRLHKSTGSPEPSLITFVINTSRYGFIMLGSSDSKKKKDAWAYL